MNDDKPDWIGNSREPTRPGWYWMWDGHQAREAVVVRLTKDAAFGFWTWACGVNFGGLATLPAAYPWRWSEPIPKPGGRGSAAPRVSGGGGERDDDG